MTKVFKNYISTQKVNAKGMSSKTSQKPKKMAKSGSKSVGGIG